VSLHIPLCVRLSTARADRHVTRDLRSLSFRSTAVGGFASCQLSLDRPLAFDAPEIALFGRLYVSDGRHGGTVWEGWQEDSGQSAGGDGQVWEVSALGPVARASDIKAPWIYYDRSLERFTRTPGAAANLATQTGTDASDNPELKLVIENATPVVAGDSFSGWMYTGMFDAGQNIARFGGSWDSYPTDGSWKVQAVAQTSRTSGSGNLVLNAGFNTAGGTFGPYLIVTDFSAGRQVVELRIARVSTNTTSVSGLAAAYTGWYVIGTRFDRFGAEILTASAYNGAFATQLQAHMVVEDLVGRLLPTYDGPNASIATNTYGIDTLAYPDGATAAEIFDDLMVLEPAYYWAAWESPPLVAGGRSRFEWRSWPTTVRYEADVDDGYTSPGSGVDLFSSAIIRWVDEMGRSRQRVRTQTVQTLTDAGISRQELLDLGSTTGSDNNAVQAGDGFLADHAAPANGGTLTVARPILDRDGGRMVQPWEIRPGHLIRINGLSARSDALLATGPDGRSVFRIAAVEYSTDSAAATLELDTWPRNVAQALSRMKKAQSVTRRK
jgi:hypothetical protein